MVKLYPLQVRSVKVGIHIVEKLISGVKSTKMEQQTIQRDYRLEAKIAKQVYGRQTEWLDTGMGFTLYMTVDEVEDKNDTLLEARVESGERVQRYGRLCPAWSTNILDVWELVQYCAAHAQFNFRLIDKPLLAPVGSTPSQIAECVLTGVHVA